MHPVTLTIETLASDIQGLGIAGGDTRMCTGGRPVGMRTDLDLAADTLLGKINPSPLLVSEVPSLACTDTHAHTWPTCCNDCTVSSSACLEAHYLAGKFICMGRGHLLRVTMSETCSTHQPGMRMCVFCSS